ncbi:hypothetical protein DVA86_19350 [Streptomyces armeniacus]|uniref:DUF7848 domain-containing protein n=1 Tax=Streptomyces armeniacus TaxID=83291 RepID=A0A345XS63_9ACTN|nr:hypothetical protein [Streptomyces armeniacus]AXK34479.1 hypothetical protein DVA86_19350 [Streptomyces armeniacus]
MTPGAFRAVPYAVVRDEAVEPTYEAECASGEIACCENSGPHRDAGPVEVWMRRHADDTGHRRCLRIFSDYALVRRGEPVPVEGCAS